jgi:RND superfamily putative drug exporter
LTVAGSPYEVPGQISPDGRTAFAAIQSGQLQIPAATAKDLMAAARTASGNGVMFAFDGPSVLTVEVPYGGPTEGFGVLAAMVVLLVSFGSLLAMGLPLVTGLVGIGPGWPSSNCSATCCQRPRSARSSRPSSAWASVWTTPCSS